MLFKMDEAVTVAVLMVTSKLTNQSH
jgi:hypothetical protein